MTTPKQTMITKALLDTLKQGFLKYRHNPGWEYDNDGDQYDFASTARFITLEYRKIFDRPPQIDAKLMGERAYEIYPYNMHDEEFWRRPKLIVELYHTLENEGFYAENTP